MTIHLRFSYFAITDGSSPSFSQAFNSSPLGNRAPKSETPLQEITRVTFLFSAALIVTIPPPLECPIKVIFS